MLRISLGALALFMSVQVAAAATLLASGTFDTTDDLTRIDDDGTVLEFLDLTSTQGMTLTEAQTAFPEFTLADQDDIAALVSAFSLPYDYNAGVYTDLNFPFKITTDPFVAALGITGTNIFGDVSFGFYTDTDSLFSNDFAGLCLGAGCRTGGFYDGVRDREASQGLIDGTGLFLVREAPTGPEEPEAPAVPLPAGLPLVLTGIGVLGLAARRKRS